MAADEPAPRGKPGETRQAVYAFVRDGVRAGRPPSVREIQEAFGFKAVQTAKEHLDKLVAEGLLTCEAGKARSYRPAEPGPEPGFPVPILGRVRAGPLAEALTDPDGHVQVVGRPAEGARLFALRIRGDSMTGAGILDGDVVIARQQQTAEPGAIVVAMVEGEATVKRLGRVGRHPALIAEHPAYPPIIVAPPSEITVLGRVVEVRRYLE